MSASGACVARTTSGQEEEEEVEVEVLVRTEGAREPRGKKRGDPLTSLSSVVFYRRPTMSLIADCFRRLTEPSCKSEVC